MIKKIGRDLFFPLLAGALVLLVILLAFRAVVWMWSTPHVLAYTFNSLFVLWITWMLGIGILELLSDLAKRRECWFRFRRFWNSR